MEGRVVEWVRGEDRIGEEGRLRARDPIGGEGGFGGEDGPRREVIASRWHCDAFVRGGRWREVGGGVAGGERLGPGVGADPGKKHAEQRDGLENIRRRAKAAREGRPAAGEGYKGDEVVFAEDVPGGGACAQDEGVDEGGEIKAQSLVVFQGGDEQAEVPRGSTGKAVKEKEPLEPVDGVRVALRDVVCVAKEVHTRSQLRRSRALVRSV